MEGGYTSLCTPVWHLEWKFSLDGGEGINHTPAA